MTTAHLRFATDILRRLGEELNPNPDQGILELVKNAYDADAVRCEVDLTNTSTPGGALRVLDDGNGMTVDDIVDGWLLLGRSRKRLDELTPVFNRIPAGSKGLGRLAALRLGRQVRMRTQPRGGAQCHAIDIHWDKFDDQGVVEEVALEINSRKAPDPHGHGTLTVVEDLRTSLGRAEVRRLARALVLLADPFGADASGFQPVLKAPEFEDLEALVTGRYFEHADYHLLAQIDDSGRASAKVTDWRGQTLYEADHVALTERNPRRSYALPPATFDLWVFILDAAAFAPRPVTIGEVREWIKAFGGVHLYLNGLRVSPYGNQGNDWLEMNLRRTRSPEERPSTNTSLGRITVHDAEGALQQKTDRTGLIEDESFEELRTFAQDALDWMARRRTEVAEQRRQVERTQAPRDAEEARGAVEHQISELPEDLQEGMRSTFGLYDRVRDKERDTLRREVQLYRTLSTAGITAATFAHESASNPIKVITQVAAVIERRGRKALDADYEELLAKPIRTLKSAGRSLSVLSSTTLALVDSEKRRVGRVDLQPVIGRIVSTFKPFFETREVKVRASYASGEPYLRGTEAAVESIVTNLLNNSLVALEGADVEQRRIELECSVAGTAFELRVNDNGPGIEGIALDEIWLPGASTSPNGTGLGLAIVRDAVRDLGGEVQAKRHGDLGGAEFMIRLPILGTS